jgi:hypothetical protein
VGALAQLAAQSNTTASAKQSRNQERGRFEPPATSDILGSVAVHANQGQPGLYSLLDGEPRPIAACSGNGGT